MKFEAQHIQINGRGVRYFEAGQPHKPTILLLHGGFGNAQLNWEAVAPQLVADFHILAPDLPGFGETEPLATMEIDQMVNWLHLFLKEFNLVPVAVVANSFSGLIARIFAIQHPKQISALVLVNGGIIPKVGGLPRFIAQLPFLGTLLFQRLANRMSDRRELKQAIVDESILTDVFVLTVQAERAGLARLMRMLATFSKPQQTTPLVPTLLLWGEEDTISPRSVGLHIHQAIPGSKMETIANVGHLPHLEVPDIFAWQLTRFIQGQ